MAAVTRQAGLSLGLANLHFDSKEKLLEETLRQVATEYNEGQRAVIEQCPPATTAQTLEHMLDFDFSAAVTQKAKLAVWFAFWGEAKSRPTYQRICARADNARVNRQLDLFAATIADGNYTDVNADFLATGYTSLVVGLWLDLLVVPRKLSRRRARSIAADYLHNAFPRHVQR